MLMAVTMVFVFFQRGTWYLMKADPDVDISWVEDAAAAGAGFEVWVASDIPETLWLQHFHVLPARLLPGGDGLDGAGCGVSGSFPCGARSASLMGVFGRFREAPPEGCPRVARRTTCCLVSPTPR